IGDAPMGHGAVGIGLGGLLEAAHGLLMVVAVAPDQPAIEPELRLLRPRRNGPMIGTEIVVVACHFPLPSRVFSSGLASTRPPQPLAAAGSARPALRTLARWARPVERAGQDFRDHPARRGSRRCGTFRTRGCARGTSRHAGP